MQQVASVRGRYLMQLASYTGELIMGYTHYFGHNRAFTGEEWADICRFAADAIAKSGIEIESTIDGDILIINGVGEDSYEDLWIEREPFSGFCKTERKPYDVVVVAVLLYCFARVETFSLSSDGDILGQSGEDKDDEYTSAQNLLHEICDYHRSHPIHDADVTLNETPNTDRNSVEAYGVRD